MEIINQIIGTPDAYIGVDGCISILRQNIISAESTEFPFRFTINLSWSESEINEAISSISEYTITYDSSSSIFTININN